MPAQLHVQSPATRNWLPRPWRRGPIHPFSTAGASPRLMTKRSWSSNRTPPPPASALGQQLQNSWDQDTDRSPVQASFVTYPQSPCVPRLPEEAAQFWGISLIWGMSQFGNYSLILNTL